MMKFTTALIFLVGAQLAFPQLPPTAAVNFRNLDNVGRVRGINKGGMIVGYTVGGDEVQGFTLQNGTVEKIAVPGSIQTLIYGVENNGRLVGAYYKDDHGGAHGFSYFHGAVSTIDFPGATSTFAHGINDPQRIVGAFKDKAGFRHGFYYDKGNFTQIDISGAVSSSATCINNPGDIVGHFTDQNGHEHGFLQDSKGKQSTIDVPFTGVTDTFVDGINSSGVMVGSYIDSAGTHGFVYTKGVFMSLDAPGTPPGIGTFVRGINDNGQLVIFGVSALTGDLAS